MEFDAVLIEPRRAAMEAEGFWPGKTVDDCFDACLAAAPNALERPGGLGWSFVLLVLLGFSVYVVLGAARQRVQGSTERWPHAEFWRELQALVRTLTTMLLVQSACIAAIRRM